MGDIADFSVSSTPKNEIALRLIAEAREQAIKAEENTNSRDGLLRKLAIKRGDEFGINPYLIKFREGWNIRDLSSRSAEDKIDELARDIKINGVLEAISVVMKGDTFYVSNGHRRVLAAKRAIEVYGAEIKSIPVRRETGELTDELLICRQFSRNSGEPLTFIDKGRGILRLVAFGWSHEQIAEKLGFDGPARVVQILHFMDDANEGIKKMVSNGEVAQTFAAEVLRNNNQDADKAEEVLAEAVKVAKAEGKTKATKKHITDKATPKVTMKTIFESAKTIIEPGDETTTITMPNAFWEQISKLYKIV